MATQDPGSENSNEGDKWYSFRLGSDPMFSPFTDFFKGVSTCEIVLCVVFFVISVIVMFILQVYWYYPDETGFDQICISTSTLPGTFYFIDVTTDFINVFIFIIFDFWAMGFSIYTILMLFIGSLFVPQAVMFPLYFGMRTSRKAKIASNEPIPSHVKWYQFLPQWILIIIFFAWYYNGVPFVSEPNPCKPN